MKVSIKTALEDKTCLKNNKTRRVLLNLNRKDYEQVSTLVKKNGMTFTAFINKILILILQDKVTVETVRFNPNWKEEN